MLKIKSAFSLIEALVAIFVLSMITLTYMNSSSVFIRQQADLINKDRLNQIADLIYNSFTLGMEDHLLEIFGGHDTKEIINKEEENLPNIIWSAEAANELTNIPGFVRSKIKKKTENFAQLKQLKIITVEVMYEAKNSLT